MRRNLRLLCAVTLLVFSPRIIAAVLRYNEEGMADMYGIAAFIAFIALLGATVGEFLDRPMTPDVRGTDRSRFPVPEEGGR